MDIQSLRCFTVFSRTMNYSHAAEELFLSRQAVSKTVRTIESALGAKLIERDGNSQKLTIAGRGFAKGADRIVSDYDELIYQYSSNQKRSSSPQVQMDALRISCSMSTLSSGVRTLLRDLRVFSSDENNRQLKIKQASSKQCYQQLLDKSTDASLISCMPRRFPECNQVLLGTIEFAAIVYAEHPFTKKECIATEDLVNQKVILLSDYEFVYERLINECQLIGFKLDPAHVIDEVDLAAEIVADHQGIMIADARSSHVWPEGFVSVPFANDQHYWCLYYVYRKDSQRVPDLMQLERFLKQCDLEGLRISRS